MTCHKSLAPLQKIRKSKRFLAESCPVAPWIVAGPPIHLADDREAGGDADRQAKNDGFPLLTILFK